MVLKIGSGCINEDEEEDETLLKNYKKPCFYICSNCGELTTWKDILDVCSNGGQGMCMCDWGSKEWDDELGDFDYVTNRIYNEYTEIHYKWYDLLSSETNEVLRLRMFNQIPKDKLLNEEDDDED